MPTSYVPNADDAQFDAWEGVTFADPNDSGYTDADAERVDAKFFLKPIQDEVLNLIRLALAGGTALPVRNQTGMTLIAGPVRVVGYSAAESHFLIDKANATGGLAAMFVILSSLNNNTNGKAYISGTLSAIMDTSAASVGDCVYLAAGGGVTLTAPTAADAIKQVIGQVKTVSVTGDVAALVQKVQILATSNLQAYAVTQPKIDFASAMATGQVLTPTALSGNTNNYAPTGLSTAAIVRISAGGSYDLTGLTGGVSGRLIYLHNVGANPITLKNESASSSAENRFSLTGDAGVGANQAVVLQYDATSARWRMVLGAASGDITAVIAGDGLTGGGTSGDVTLAANPDLSTIEFDASSPKKLRVKDTGITYAKIQNVSSGTVLGRATAGSGVVEEITCTAAGRALIDDASAAAQRTTLGVDPMLEVSAKTGAYTVVDPDDKNTVFTNEGAGSIFEFALPSAAAGMGSFTFVVQNANGLKVRANTGDTIRNGSSLSSTAGYAQSTVIGSVMTIVAINSSEWIAISSVGTWSVA